MSNGINKYYIFGKNGGKQLAEEFDTPLLGQIPIVQSICEGGDLGVPAVMSDDEITKEAFAQFAKNAARQVSIHNANIEATKVVEMVR